MHNSKGNNLSCQPWPVEYTDACMGKPVFKVGGVGKMCIIKLLEVHTVLIQSHNTGHEWNPCTFGLLFPPAALNLLCVARSSVDNIIHNNSGTHAVLLPPCVNQERNPNTTGLLLNLQH